MTSRAGIPGVGPAGLTSTRAALIAGGGALGAGVRWVTVEHVLATGGRFPWAVLLVNVVGSVIAGWAIVVSARLARRASLLVDGVGSGFCGGLTTFSAFAVDTALLARAGDGPMAFTYLTATLAVGIGGAAVGVATASRVGAPGAER